MLVPDEGECWVWCRSKSVAFWSYFHNPVACYHPTGATPTSEVKCFYGNLCSLSLNQAIYTLSLLYLVLYCLKFFFDQALLSVYKHSYCFYCVTWKFKTKFKNISKICFVAVVLLVLSTFFTIIKFQTRVCVMIKDTCLPYHMNKF